MIYETLYLKSNEATKANFKAKLEEIGFINIPNQSPAYGEDPDRYYWKADTRREFYLYFGNLATNPNIYGHVVSGGNEYDFRFTPWNPGGGIGDSLITYTPLYNGGIRFGIRARNEMLFEFYSGQTDYITDYRVGYNNEEIDASYYPANWFAIVAPERTGDEWAYVIFQKKGTEVETGHYVTDFQQPVVYFHDEIIDIGNITNSVFDDFRARAGMTYSLVPYFNIGSNNQPVKFYNNVYKTATDSRYKFNKVIEYNTEKYICLSYRGPYVRFR